MSDMDVDQTSLGTAMSNSSKAVEVGQLEAKEDELDHLFDNLDDVEITKAENPWQTKTTSLELFSAKDSGIDHLAGDSLRQFKLFYRHFFPAKPYFQWLNYSNSPIPSKNFMNREFSFFLMDETFMRYQSFKSLDELKQELTRLCPTRIDLGAVYNIRPKDKNMVRSGALTAVSKELVFDIDMTDYDEIRTCCSGGDVCTKCWEFMTVAMKIIDTALREDFGFKHLLWVYSGRRGVHCWVADMRARVMTNDQRKAIVQYLEVVKGGAHQVRKVKLPSTLHPSLSRSRKTLENHFRNLMFSSQDILTTPKQWEKVLAIIPDQAIQDEIRKEWESAPTRAPAEKWENLKTIIDQKTNVKSPLRAIHLDIMFQYTYPRLDDKVSIDIRHLLKSPFCIHPKTGRVCVPIPIETCDNFDPTSAPTVPQLVKELNEYDERHPSNGNSPKLQDDASKSLEF
ncbi:hypothetical protein BX616_003549 [Lobosporangium transversale]|nr:hypothetical protein BX616_003549 [Lobosporangium transversale]